MAIQTLEKELDQDLKSLGGAILFFQIVGMNANLNEILKVSAIVTSVLIT